MRHRLTGGRFRGHLRLVQALLVGLVAALVASSPAAALPRMETDPAPPPAAEDAAETPAANPWLGRRVAHFAHQGGEYEAPSNTMYAFRRGLAQGADVLELDVHPTGDGQLVVLHDATLDRTTNGTGQVRDRTLAQIQELDAAYNFVPDRNAVPGQPAGSYPFRGVRTGAVPPPEGYRPDDFRVPTLAEVLAAFPDVPVNIEIKGRSDSDNDSFLRTAELLAAQLTDLGRTDVIVVSFKQVAIKHFHRLAPHIPVAPGIGGLLRFTVGFSPGGGTAALQIPVRLSGVPVASRWFVKRAHNRGYAVHVYLDAETEENDATYRKLVDACVDGIMTGFPSRLERFLRAEAIARPGRPGTDPCAD